MSLYLDTNVIVALFRSEPASAQALSWLTSAAEPILISDFGAVEFAAVLSREVRSRAIGEAQAQAILTKFDIWRGQAVRLIAAGPADMRRAEAFVRDFSTKLQAPDTLHLALAVNAGSILATFDLCLAEAARRLALPVLAQE